jgi:nucleotide-binding universal stress UspA family protein
LASTGHFIADAAVIAIRAAATADQQAAAEKILAVAEQAVHEDVAGLSITTEVVRESADKALTELSRTARLVVVGCDDVNPVAALLLGSTSLAVATHAVCPVVVWRGDAMPTTKPVVVGVDGTPAGAAALAAAFEYADRFKVSVKAVHSWLTTLPVDGVTIPYLIDWDALEAAEWALLANAVDEWTTRYPEVDVQLFVVPVKAGRALMQHLADAQLVVVGSRRRNALTAAVLGSTTLNLLHHSGVPVMVCHVPEGGTQ